MNKQGKKSKVEQSMNKYGEERKEVQRIVRNKQRKERKVEPVEYSVKDE